MYTCTQLLLIFVPKAAAGFALSDEFCVEISGGSPEDSNSATRSTKFNVRL